MNTQIQSNCALLMELWSNLIEGQRPPERQFNLWLQIHKQDVELISWGLQKLALKLTNKQMDDTYRVKFVSSIINTRSKELSKVKTQEAI